MRQCLQQSGLGFPHTAKPCPECHFGPCPVEREQAAVLDKLLAEALDGVEKTSGTKEIP